MSTEAAGLAEGLVAVEFPEGFFLALRFLAEILLALEALAFFWRRGIVGHEPELGVVTPDGHFGENVQHALVGIVRKFYGAELVEKLDTPDDGAADVGLAGDGAYDVPGGHVVPAAHRQIITQVAFFYTVGAFLAFLAGLFRHVVAVAIVFDLRGRELLHLGEQRFPFLGHAEGGCSDVFDICSQFHRHLHEDFSELVEVCVC